MLLRHVLAALLLTVPGFLPGLAAAATEGGRAGYLAAELEAARSHELYLLLDPRGPQIDLKASGLLLQRFPVESALFGSPRLGGGDASWPAASFRLVSELPEPERPQVAIGKSAPPEAAGLGKPVTEADLDGVPTHYRLRFAPALDLSVLGEAGVPDFPGRPGRLWRLRHRLLEGWGALARRLTGEAVPPRVVLFMRPEDARRLFVALKADTRLVVRF